MAESLMVVVLEFGHKDQTEVFRRRENAMKGRQVMRPEPSSPVCHERTGSRQNHQGPLRLNKNGRSEGWQGKLPP